MTWIVRAVLFTLFTGAVEAQEAPPIRFLNGAPVPGEVVNVSAEGVEVRAAGATKVHPWSALSSGTRFRYDPQFRVNLPVAQRGEAVAAWTNPAPAPYSVNPAIPQAAVEPVAPVSAFLPLDVFPPASERPRASLPHLDVKNGDLAITWGLHYGTAETETIFFVLEPREPGDLPGAADVITTPEKRAERLRGSRRSDGGETNVTFRKQELSASIGDIQLTYEIALAASSREPDQVLVTADIGLKRGKETSLFSLQGAPPGQLLGDGNVTPRPLLAPPVLHFTVQHFAGKPLLVGNVRMGPLKLIPLSGMGRQVKVTLDDASGATVLTHQSGYTLASPADRYSLVAPLENVPAGQKYRLFAEADLGPFFGVVQYEGIAEWP